MKGGCASFITHREEAFDRGKQIVEKQEEKKRMKATGSVELPQEAFLCVLKIGE